MKKEAPQKKISETGKDDMFVLVLINDDVNTFDHVIKSLVEICGHDLYQAEQCAMITHFRGSCEVKIGHKEILASMSRNIGERGLLSRVDNKL